MLLTICSSKEFFYKNKVLLVLDLTKIQFVLMFCVSRRGEFFISSSRPWFTLPSCTVESQIFILMENTEPNAEHYLFENLLSEYI